MRFTHFIHPLKHVAHMTLASSGSLSAICRLYCCLKWHIRAILEELLNTCIIEMLVLFCFLQLFVVSPYSEEFEHVLYLQGPFILVGK